MAKYKVGDKVKVRKDLEVGEEYGGMIFLSDMAKFRGKTVTINCVKHAWYGIEGYHDTFWSDETFEGLAEEEHKGCKFKVGDKVIGNELANKYTITRKGWIGYVNEVISDTQIRVDDCRRNGGMGVEVKCFDLLGEEPKSTPTPVVNLNVTIDLYENACWYCRKGGVVDVYLAGAMGICPSCGRVCNNTRPFKMEHKGSAVIEFKAKEPEKPKENKPLTTEELRALPNETKVFVVWCKDGKGEETWCKNYTCWRRKRGDCLIRQSGSCSIANNGKYFKAYLEEPERPF